MEDDADCPVSDRTTRGYRPAASVGGSCALIWEGEVASRESGVLLSVTQAPPSSVGSGELAAVAAEARLAPKIEIKPPGATVPRKSAVFTTPFPGTCGTFGVVDVASGITLRPEAVSTNAVAPAESSTMPRPRTLTRVPARATAEVISSAPAVAVVREVLRSITSTRPVSEGVALAAVTGMLKRAKLEPPTAATAATGRPVEEGPPGEGSGPPPEAPVPEEPIGVGAWFRTWSLTR